MAKKRKSYTKKESTDKPLKEKRVKKTKNLDESIDIDSKKPRKKRSKTV